MSRFTHSITAAARKAWHAYSSHRQAVAEAKARGAATKPPDPASQTIDATLLPVFQLADLESESLTRDERIKSAFSQCIGTVAPFVLALILSVSNGYFFAGFHDFAWNIPTVLAYVGGTVLELIGLAAIFTAQRALKEGTRSFFLSAFLFAFSLALVSLLAQYLYLQLLEIRGGLTIPDGAIARIPIVSWLIGVNGMQGHDWLFLIRGGAFHLAEIGCTFLISKKQKSLRRLIAQQRELQDARLMWERNQLLTDMERTIADQLALMMSQQRKVTELQFNNYLAGLTSQQQLPEGSVNTDPFVLPTLNGKGSGKPPK